MTVLKEVKYYVIKPTDLRVLVIILKTPLCNSPKQ